MLILEPGKKIASRYEVVECIAPGGYGVVWKLLDHQLNRNVAMKRINLESPLDSKKRVAEANEEARKVAAITSPFVVQVYDLLSFEDELLIVMEFMPGGTLHDLLRKLSREKKWIGAPNAFRILKSVLQGLDAAHNAANGPIIHRDLKPQNLLFDGNWNIKIADFGLAAVGPVEAIETKHPGRWEHSGTSGYKSPEQLNGDELDIQTDLFNLGLIACLLFCAVHPHVCPRLIFEYKEMVLEPYREFPTVIDTNMPDTVGSFLSTLLSKLPAERFRTAGEALVELETIESAYDERLFDKVLEFHDSLKIGTTHKGISADELEQGIYLCRKRGFYHQGAFLYEKSGIDLNTILPSDSRRVTEDYQYCRRRAGKEVIAG